MGKNRKAMDNGTYSKLIRKEYEYLPTFTRIILKGVKTLCTGIILK